MDQLFNSGVDVVNQYVVPWSVNISMALLVYLIGRWLARITVRIVKRLMERANIDASLRSFAGHIISVTLTIVVLIAALDQLGIDTTSIVAVFATAGLAVGLAMKDSLSNFAAGVMLIIFKPFKVGDVITAAGSTGVVEAIRIFNTVLRSGDNQEITIPNSHIFGSTITNITCRETRRIDLLIGIGYDDNIGQAKQLLEQIMAGHEAILDDPAPAVIVMELGDSSIILAVRPWVNTADYWTVRSQLLQTIRETFAEQGISIPYPQRDVHLIHEPALEKNA